MSESVTVTSGDIVKAEEDDFYSSPPDSCCIDDKWYYVELRTTSPDGDNDLKCYYLDSRGERVDTGYVDADSFDTVAGMLPWEVDDELEERLDENEVEEDALDVLDEEKENLLQMQEIKSRTVAPDVLKLDVNKVVSAENSQQWAILVDHPTLGEMRFYEQKPITGWSEDYRIVRLLKSYGIYDGNPYKLQTKQVFVEFTGDDPEMDSYWDLLMRDKVVEEYGASPETSSPDDIDEGSKKSESDGIRSLVARLF